MDQRRVALKLELFPMIRRLSGLCATAIKRTRDNDRGDRIVAELLIELPRPRELRVGDSRGREHGCFRETDVVPIVLAAVLAGSQAVAADTVVVAIAQKVLITAGESVVGGNLIIEPRGAVQIGARGDDAGAHRY